MFTESAELYDAIYFAFKDYTAEAAQIADRIRKVNAEARTILDVACGTGEHARLLASIHGFHVDGIDLNPEFVRLAQAKNPAGHFWVADIIDFDLARTYDAVICMFSSIGYVRTLDRLERALHSLKRHLAPRGVLIIEPWFPPGKLTPGHHSTRVADQGEVHVERSATTTLEGRLSRLQFEYVITQGSDVRHASEIHELGMFTEAETLAALDAVGLASIHEAASSEHRGLYIAKLVHT